jgi:hypothetical protein
LPGQSRVFLFLLVFECAIVTPKEAQPDDHRNDLDESFGMLF